MKKLGFKVLNSSANFIFISHKDIYAGDLYKELKENGVLVRYFSKDRIDNYLRVTIGTDEEMGIFIEKLEEIIFQREKFWFEDLYQWLISGFYFDKGKFNAPC